MESTTSSIVQKVVEDSLFNQGLMIGGILFVIQNVFWLGMKWGSRTKKVPRIK